MKNSREPRATESRTAEIRANEIRETYDMDYVSPLSVPPGVIQEGYSGRWISTNYKGAENFRIEESSRQGWTMVPRDRAPGLNLDPLNKNPLSKQYFVTQDVILMEIPTEILKSRDMMRNQKRANKIKSLKGVTLGAADNRAISGISSF